MNEVTVTRSKKRIITSSKVVYIPLPPVTQKGGVGTSPPDLPPRDSDVYSDVEDTDEPLETKCHEQKAKVTPLRYVFPLNSLFNSSHVFR